MKVGDGCGLTRYAPTMQHLVQAIEEEFSLAGLAVRSVEHLVDYFLTLQRWNRRIRLVGASDAEVIVRRHLADALQLAVLVPDNVEYRCVDVGSGGGLPGIPFSILRPHCRLTLVESRSRKCAFLTKIASQLRLSVSVYPRRIEVCEDLVGACDWAWSLATFSPAEWVRRAAQLIRPEGRVVAFGSANESVPPCEPEFETQLSLEKEVAYEPSAAPPRRLCIFRLLESAC